MSKYSFEQEYRDNLAKENNSSEAHADRRRFMSEIRSINSDKSRKPMSESGHEYARRMTR